MEGSCDEYDGIERAIVSQGYEGLSRNYHPDNIHFTFFSVDPFRHYHCDIDEQQGANPYLMTPLVKESKHGRDTGIQQGYYQN